MAFERYYKGRLAGESHDAAKTEAEKVFVREVNGDQYDSGAVAKASIGFEKYMQYYGDELDEWEIIAIEEPYKMPIPQRSEFDYAMRVDVLQRHRRTGELVLRDFKFTYDFWKPRKFTLRGQFPKYVIALRYNEIHVSRVIIDQIRYREMKSTDLTDYLQRDAFVVSDTKIRHILLDHINLSDEIMAFRALTPQQQEKKATRLLVEPLCKYCPFAELCELELEGGSTELFIQSNYKKNEYGYNHEQDETLVGVA